jgi:hypothetical protein
MPFTQIKQAAAALTAKMHADGLSGPFLVLLTPAAGERRLKGLSLLERSMKTSQSSREAAARNAELPT